MSSSDLRAATRGSELALWQTSHVAELLGRISSSQVELEVLVVSTSGDRDQQTPIADIGGKGMFVKEIQSAVLDGRADIAVHSAKDLPAVTPPGLVLAAVPTRADPSDALVGSTLEGLSRGAVVATGSRRRRAQLSAVRPDLLFRELRGNIATRLGVLDNTDVDAIIVATAALQRLGLDDRIAHRFEIDAMVPQVGQGALAIECRIDDDRTRMLLAQIEDPTSRLAVDAERSFLLELDGDCDLPAGAHARVIADAGSDASAQLQLTGVLEDASGRLHRRVEQSSDADDLGRVVARYLLAS